MGTWHCWKARRAIHALLDGELSPGRAARLEEHVAQCAACAQLREDLCGWETVLRQAEPDLPPDSEFAALAQRISTAVRQLPQPASLQPRPAWRPSWAVAGGMAALSLALGLTLGRVAVPQPPQRVVKELVYVPAEPTAEAPIVSVGEPQPAAATSSQVSSKLSPGPGRAGTVTPRRAATTERRLAMRVPQEEAWGWADRVAPVPAPPQPTQPAPEAPAPARPAAEAALGGLGGGAPAPGDTGTGGADVAEAVPPAAAPGGATGPQARMVSAGPQEVRPPAAEMARVAMVLTRDVSRAGDALRTSGLGSAFTASFSAAARELDRGTLDAAHATDAMP